MRMVLTFLIPRLMPLITASWPVSALSLGVWMQWKWPGAVRAFWKVH